MSLEPVILMSQRFVATPATLCKKAFTWPTPKTGYSSLYLIPYNCYTLHSSRAWRIYFKLLLCCPLLRFYTYFTSHVVNVSPC